ncbi:ASPIC/UnbV domain-containing protein [Thiolapillus sp.]|uniref:ASPIC/UnbV domain-containing protein n=1 Tax=Thiolapillus sp. TaxID=2017437 RepID=UPI0025F6DFAB|nr:ASPIC/UnbV domain-containing protein [Thiolapillus sp.]
MREVHASNGLSAQGDARLLFGLGDYQGDVLVRIRWCGDRQQERHVASGRYLRIDYPSSS